MKLFGGRKRRPGWLCINVMPNRVDVSHVLVRDRTRPELLLCESFRRDGDDVNTLRRLRRELELDRYHCTTLLKPGEYQIHQVETPDVPADEVKSALRWRMKDVVDFPVEAATVDGVNIPGDSTGRAPQMLAVAAKNEVIAGLLQSFADAEIDLQVIDIPELAQRNVGRLWEEEGRAVALLCFAERAGLLTFSAGGELYLARQLDISMEGFIEADEEQRRALYDRVVLELQRSLDHFDRQFHYIPVSKLVLAPVPEVEELQRHLAAALEIPVTVLDFSAVMDFGHIPELRNPLRQSQCLQLIGGALRDEAAA